MHFSISFNIRSEEIYKFTPDETERYFQYAKHDNMKREQPYEKGPFEPDFFTSDERKLNLADRTRTRDSRGPQDYARRGPLFGEIVRWRDIDRSYLRLLYEKEFQFNFKKGLSVKK